MRKLDQQIAFIMELDRLKAVLRQTRIQADNYRQENSAEHSWHIALVAQVFREYASDAVDINRVTMMLLIHDIVEIDAGDTFAFAEQAAQDAQEAKEFQAAERIFGLLPEVQSQPVLALWHEFERAETADAQFAKAMDRILPLFQNMQGGGGSWVQHKVTRAQVCTRNEYLKLSAPKLWDYACEQIELATKNGWLTE